MSEQPATITWDDIARQDERFRDATERLFFSVKTAHEGHDLPDHVVDHMHAADAQWRKLQDLRKRMGQKHLDAITPSTL